MILQTLLYTPENQHFAPKNIKQSQQLKRKNPLNQTPPFSVGWNRQSFSRVYIFVATSSGFCLGFPDPSRRSNSTATSLKEVGPVANSWSLMANSFSRNQWHECYEKLHFISFFYLGTLYLINLICCPLNFVCMFLVKKPSQRMIHKLQGQRMLCPKSWGKRVNANGVPDRNTLQCAYGCHISCI